MATLNYRDPGTGQFVPVSGGGPPIGVITPFVSMQPPTGWIICDGRAHGSAELQAIIGSANTPDLKDRFVVAAGTTMPAKSTGGAATVTLTAAQTGSGSHTHTTTIGAESATHTHSIATDTQSHTHTAKRGEFVHYADMSNTANANYLAMNQKASVYFLDQGNHTHSGTSANQSASHSHTVALNASTAVAAASSHANEPPYYAMIYIIRAS